METRTTNFHSSAYPSDEFPQEDEGEDHPNEHHEYDPTNLHWCRCRCRCRVAAIKVRQSSRSVPDINDELPPWLIAVIQPVSTGQVTFPRKQCSLTKSRNDTTHLPSTLDTHTPATRNAITDEWRPNPCTILTTTDALAT